jgi:hypothetical protein
LKLVNDENNEVKLKQEKRKPAESTDSLVANKRDSKDIKRIINNIIDQDKDLSKTFMSKADSKENLLVARFRDEQLKTLYQLIEVVLLNQKSGNLTKGVLEERLAAIMTPKGGDQVKTSLSVIDAYLNEANSENLIKEALRIVKPFYFYIRFDYLNREAQKVLEAMKVYNTNSSVLVYYMFH